MNISDITEYLIPGKHVHLVGIGGVSMQPLAEVLLGMGMVVTGSDINDGPTVELLRGKNINVIIGHCYDNAVGADLVIRTAAVYDDNPEIKGARDRGIPVFERAQAWGALMRKYQNALCISGTHGKTTTTSMATHIFMEAQLDPTVMIGGTLAKLHSGYRVGQGNTIILESCEYKNSFHSFFPTIAVILNVDADHLDFFSDLESVSQSFRHFAELVPPNGTVIANADDPNTMATIAGLDRNIVTFGIDNPADVSASNIEINSHNTSFDVIYRGQPFAHVSLPVPGKHNVMNALAAIAAAVILDVPAEAIQKGLSDFTGAGRRLEFKGMYNGAKIYDDYAHHPSELNALFSAVGELNYDRIICVFQPHTYSRTKLLFDEFAAELKRPDITIIADIYAAREQNTFNISSSDIAAACNALYLPSFDSIAEKLRETAQPGDIILTVGAGDIFKVGEALAEKA